MMVDGGDSMTRVDTCPVPNWELLQPSATVWQCARVAHIRSIRTSGDVNNEIAVRYSKEYGYMNISAMNSVRQQLD